MQAHSQAFWKSGQKWRPTLLYFQKWHPTFAEKHMKAFFGRHTKKGLHDLCGRKSVAKVAQKLFGKVWGNSGKNPLHP